MAAKESQEMRNALRLVAEGVPVRIAAETAGVWYTSLYAKIAGKRRKVEADYKARGQSATVTPEAIAKRMIAGQG